MEISYSPSQRVVIDGHITDGTTDGNTFSLTAARERTLCGGSVTGEVTISGGCGDDATVRYDETHGLDHGSGTLTGDVECTLTQVDTNQEHNKTVPKPFLFLYRLIG